jgi:diguanylate cyclase (GGDEF)-like protein
VTFNVRVKGSCGTVDALKTPSGRFAPQHGDPKRSRGGGSMTAADERSCQDALGRAVHARGDEISRSVLTLWEKRCPAAAARGGARVRDDIVQATLAATAAITTYLIHHATQTPEQKRAEAKTGKAPLRETMSLADLTKLYLYWRDSAIKVVREEAARLGLHQSATDTAIEAVRAGSDASIVRMVKQFDTERDRLQHELQHEQALLAHEAMHDALTGLPNRKLFFDRLSQALARAVRQPTSVAVLFIDIDHFKTVNDTYGHRVGDQLLLAVAARLSERVRRSDTVARLAGDEFVILYEFLDQPERQAVALQQRVDHAFIDPFVIGTTSLSISASTGLAIATDDCDPDILLTRADHAMYQAKQSSPSRRAPRPHDTSQTV